MTKRIHAALSALALLAAVALSHTATADAAALCDGHHQCQHKAARRAPRRARVSRERARTRRRVERRAVAYVCPMHPDIREQSRGTCPKCQMDLVAEPRGAQTEAGGASGGM